MRPRIGISATLICLLTACTQSVLPSAIKSVPAEKVAESYSTETLDTLRQASCPSGDAVNEGTPVSITATPVDLIPAKAKADLPDYVQFVSGWSLTSDNPAFGGLSGLTQLNDGNFLSVSDDGAFVWIDMADEKPAGTGNIAFMRAEDGTYLQGKTNADSEGLAFKDGVAFVSFERQHRVEAFDLETCGSDARAVLVSALPDMIDDKPIPSNGGAEALAFTPQLTAGYETSIDRKTALAEIGAEGIQIILNEPVSTEYSAPLVGMTDALASGPDAVTVYSLRRSYNPIFGNKLTVEATTRTLSDGKTTQTQKGLFTLAPPMSVDNFEGITAEVLADGTHRFWILSDNNFSPKQRTLLFAFDIHTEMPDTADMSTAN